MKTHTLFLLAMAALGVASFKASGHPGSGIVVDERGNVFFSDLSRGVLKVDPEGKVSTMLKSESPWAPCGVALRGEDIYVLEHIDPNSEAHESWPPRVRKLTPDGKVTTLVNFASERK